ncbi:PAS domain-containing protein, partial [Shewanella sp. 0m-11]
MSAIPKPQIDTANATDAVGKAHVVDVNAVKRPQLVDVQQAANMSNRLDHILQAMPSGVVIINGDGMVTDANPVAIELLGSPLEGLRWLQIINRAFSPQDDDGHEVSLRNGRRVKLAITPLTPEPGQLIVLTDLTETRLLQK